MRKDCELSAGEFHETWRKVWDAIEDDTEKFEIESYDALRIWRLGLHLYLFAKDISEKETPEA